MKKFNINFFPFAVALLLFGSACEGELELQPAQDISEDLALDSDGNVKAVLVGAYDELGVDDLFGGETLRNSELLGGDGEVRWVGTFEAPGDIFNKAMIATNLDVQEVWLEAYETINITNNVLSALNVVDEDDRATVEGEALFIRAMLYFELVRFYGLPYEAGQANNQPGVPLLVQPTRGITEADNVARATVADIYDQIVGDLTKAAAQLPADNQWRASSGAASALLARVYLQMGEYENARDAANAVIESGNYSLLSNYADIFGRDENSNEDIFSIQITTQDGVNAMNLFFATPQFGGRDGDVEVLSGHLDLYDPADARLALFYEDNGGVTYSGKWTNQFGNIGLIRLAEMYLIRAEANQRLGTSVGAAPVDDYNAVHTRAGLPAAASVTLEDILLERRLELAHEGHKIHDVKRLQENVGSFAYDDPKLVFPIPNREINANPNLEQNTGY